MTNDIKKRVHTIQAKMAESVGSCFSQTELGHLNALVRLTVEFHGYLQGVWPAGKARDSLRSNWPAGKLLNDLQSANIDPSSLDYICGSVFAGVESYISVTRGYKVLVGAMDSRIEWSTISFPSIKVQFVPMFDEFVKEENFESKCRLLLDLFKLQIVFAGLSYD
jgi:hypothetical protein